MTQNGGIREWEEWVGQGEKTKEMGEGNNNDMQHEEGHNIILLCVQILLCDQLITNNHLFISSLSAAAFYLVNCNHAGEVVLVLH